MLVEVLVASSLLTLILVSVGLYYKKVLDVSEDTTRHIQSGFLLEEGIEALKQMRDEGWTSTIASLTPGTTYYFLWNGSKWTTTSAPQKVENLFYRSFVLADVYRDGSDNIASAGTLDPGTKKVSMKVEWRRQGGNATTTESAETYITNLFSN